MKKIDLSAMLRGNNDSINADRLVVVIFNGHLRFSVGTEIRKSSVLSHLGKSYSKLMSKGYRQRHKLLCLVTSVTEHKALVARTRIESVVHASLFCLKRLVNTESYIGRLLVNRADDRTAIAVKTELRAGVSDLADSFANDRLKINVSFCRDLSHYGNESRGTEGLTRDARHRVLAKKLVKYRVGNFVAYFIGMSFCYRF